MKGREQRQSANVKLRPRTEPELASPDPLPGLNKAATGKEEPYRQRPRRKDKPTQDEAQRPGPAGDHVFGAYGAPSTVSSSKHAKKGAKQRGELAPDETESSSLQGAPRSGADKIFPSAGAAASDNIRDSAVLLKAPPGISRQPNNEAPPAPAVASVVNPADSKKGARRSSSSKQQPTEDRLGRDSLAQASQSGSMSHPPGFQPSGATEGRANGVAFEGTPPRSLSQGKRRARGRERTYPSWEIEGAAPLAVHHDLHRSLLALTFSGGAPLTSPCA